MCVHSDPEPVTAKTIALRTLQVRVKNEAKKLDKSHKGWHKQITNLDMQYKSKCISGQLGLLDSHNEKRAFFLPLYVPIMHKGKSLGASGVGDYGRNEAYKVLTRLWNHQIAVRKRKHRKVAA